MSSTVDKEKTQVRVSPQTYEMLDILKKERGSFDDVIQDMLSEFCPDLFETVKMETEPDVEVRGLGTPEYAKWRLKTLKSAAKLTYIEFKKREWRRIQDGEFPLSPRMCARKTASAQKNLVVPY